MNEEEILKRITGLLEQGCTMLAQHHDCGAPLFRCKGKILCPACSFGAVNLIDIQANEAELATSKLAGTSKGAHERDHDKSYERDHDGSHEREMLFNEMPVIDQAKEFQEIEQSRLQSLERTSIASSQDSKELPTITRPEINALLRKVLLYKLKELSDNIRREQDLSRLRAMLDCIETAVRILSVLNEET